jgi:hypothetical protein
MLAFKFVVALGSEIDPELRKLLMGSASRGLVFILCQMFLRQPYLQQLLLFLDLLELVPGRCGILVTFSTLQ